MRCLIVPPLILALAACSPPDRVVSVDEARDNLIVWHGELITIEGWLGRCERLDCAIFPNKETLNASLAAEYGSAEQTEAYARTLSIGYAEKFDAVAAPLQGKLVQITGRLDRSCTPPFGTCLDRAPDIQPIGINIAEIK